MSSGTERCHGCGRPLAGSLDKTVQEDGHPKNCPIRQQAEATQMIAGYLGDITVDDGKIDQLQNTLKGIKHQLANIVGAVGHD